MTEVTCTCGESFETPLKRKTHQLSGACKRTTTTGRKIKTPRPQRTIRRSRPMRRSHGPWTNEYPLHIREELERKGYDDATTVAAWQWHLPVSIYWHDPEVRNLSGGEHIEQLRRRQAELSDRIMQAIRELDLEDVVIFNVKGGWNTSECRIEESRRLKNRIGKDR